MISDLLSSDMHVHTVSNIRNKFWIFLYFWHRLSFFPLPAMVCPWSPWPWPVCGGQSEGPAWLGEELQRSEGPGEGRREITQVRTLLWWLVDAFINYMDYFWGAYLQLSSAKILLQKQVPSLLLTQTPLLWTWRCTGIFWYKVIDKEIRTFFWANVD